MGVCGNSGFLLGTNVSTLDRIARVWSNLFEKKEKKKQTDIQFGRRPYSCNLRKILIQI